MKKINKRSNFNLLSLVICLVPLLVRASDPFGFNNDIPDNTPQAPIDNYLILAIGIAILIAYQLIKNKSKCNITLIGYKKNNL